MFAVMKNWHLMIGRDIHIQVLPPPAPPVPAMIYVTGMLMSGTLGWVTTAKYFPTHNTAGFGFTMAKGTDIGPLIPHFGPMPHITLPIEILGSASKSHFGASSYAGRDNSGSDNIVCVAVLGFTNINLNCGTPMPLPVGLVVCPNTHFAMMTLGDFFAGLIDMAVDFLIQWALNKAGDAVANRIFNALRPQYFASRAAAKAFLRAQGTVRGRDINAAKRALFEACDTPFRRGANSAINTILTRGVGAYVVGFFGGSPTGADASNVPGMTSGYAAATGALSPSTSNNPADPPPCPTYL